MLIGKRKRHSTLSEDTQSAQTETFLAPQAQLHAFLHEYVQFITQR